MFYGSWRHLETFSGGFLVRICLLGCLLRYLVKSSVFNGRTFGINNRQAMFASSVDSHDLESPGCRELQLMEIFNPTSTGLGLFGTGKALGGGGGGRQFPIKYDPDILQH